MKKENKHKNRISQIKEIVKGITPQEYRYISKKVREESGLSLPKAPKKLPDYLNPAEIYHILSISKDKPVDSLLIEFLIFTGLRISEARNLIIQNIDWMNNQLKVVCGKGNKDRYVPITENLQSKLKLYLKGRTSGYLFCRKKDQKQYTKRALQKKVENMIKKCDFNKKLSTHSLRHTFACLCLSRGLRIEDIKLLMGHSSIKTTEIYAKLELGSIKEKYMSLMDMRG